MINFIKILIPWSPCRSVSSCFVVLEIESCPEGQLGQVEGGATLLHQAADKKIFVFIVNVVLVMKICQEFNHVFAECIESTLSISELRLASDWASDVCAVHFVPLNARSKPESPKVLGINEGIFVSFGDEFPLSMAVVMDDVLEKLHRLCSVGPKVVLVRMIQCDDVPVCFVLFPNNSFPDWIWLTEDESSIENGVILVEALPRRSNELSSLKMVSGRNNSDEPWRL